MTHQSFSTRGEILAFAFTKTETPAEAMELAEQIAAFVGAGAQVQAEAPRQRMPRGPQPLPIAASEAEALLKSGLSQSETAARIGVSLGQLQRAIKRGAVAYRQKPQRDDPRATFDLALASDLLGKGVPRSSVARAIGCSRWTIWSLIKSGALAAPPCSPVKLKAAKLAGAARIAKRAAQ